MGENEHVISEIILSDSLPLSSEDLGRVKRT